MFNLTSNRNTLGARNCTCKEYQRLQNVKERVDRYQHESPDWAVSHELKDYRNARANEEAHRINELDKIRQSFK